MQSFLAVSSKKREKPVFVREWSSEYLESCESDGGPSAPVEVVHPPPFPVASYVFASGAVNSPQAQQDK